MRGFIVGFLVAAFLGLLFLAAHVQDVHEDACRAAGGVPIENGTVCLKKEQVLK